MTVTFTDAGDRKLVAIADAFADAVTAINPDITVAFTVTTCGSSTLLALNVDSPNGTIVIGGYDADRVTIDADHPSTECLFYIGDGLDALVDLTVARLADRVPV